MKSVFTLTHEQVSHEHKTSAIKFEDTFDKYESVTSGEYPEKFKRRINAICSLAMAKRLPYNYCIERNGREKTGAVFLSSDFAATLASLAHGLSEWLVEYYCGTKSFAHIDFENCDDLSDFQLLSIANDVLNEEKGPLYDVTWKRYIEAAAKDLVPKEGLSAEKYASVCRSVEDRLYAVVYRTAVFLKKHPEKLDPWFDLGTDVFTFAKIMFSEMLAAGIPAICGE